MKKPRKTFVGEEKFRIALQLSLDGFAILKAIRQEGKIVDFEWDYLNPAGGGMLRLKPEELLGKSLLKTLPISKARLFEDYARVVETGEPLELEVAYQSQKSSGWWRNMVVKLEDGIAVSWRDITERKHWEESLKQSEARFRVIAQSQMIGLFFWDEKKEILDANEAFLRILGYKQEEFFGQSLSWESLTPVEFWDRDREALAEVKKTGVCQPFEKELYAQDGSRVPVLLGAARLPAINYEGVAFVVDINERKAIEKEREILLGHELKTPLAGIKSLAQLLQSRFQKKGDQKTVEYLSKIDQKADWLTSLINDLSDLSRAKTGKLEFRDEFWDFDQLVKEGVADFQAGIKSHRIVLKGKTGKVVQVDKTRFLQVLNNLLSNAVKYSPQAKKVLVSLSNQEKEAAFAVEDFGVGIPLEDKKKIFQPFFRSTLSQDLSAGVGVGLYICSEILKHYSGRIEFKSQEGEGSCFRVFWPLPKPPATL
ncbi:MAG TPA: PAS domain-containing sensor histidine kinase [Clostridia bacterium]|nr:PAS domain-containing sensor histidine kinase [Clostridia bacterium]